LIQEKENKHPAARRKREPPVCGFLFVAIRQHQMLPYCDGVFQQPFSMRRSIATFAAKTSSVQIPH